MLATLIQMLAAGEAVYVAGRVRRAVVVYTVAAIAFSIGSGFFLVAAFMVVARRFGSLEAALGFGAGFVVIAGVALVVHSIRSKILARRRAKELRSTQFKALAGATAFAILPSLLKGRGGLLQIVAPILAIAAIAIYNEHKGAARPEDDPK